MSNRVLVRPDPVPAKRSRRALRVCFALLVLLCCLVPFSGRLLVDGREAGNHVWALVLDGQLPDVFRSEAAAKALKSGAGEQFLPGDSYGKLFLQPYQQLRQPVCRPGVDQEDASCHQRLSQPIPPHQDHIGQQAGQKRHRTDRRIVDAEQKAQGDQIRESERRPAGAEIGAEEKERGKNGQESAEIVFVEKRTGG